MRALIYGFLLSALSVPALAADPAADKAAKSPSDKCDCGEGTAGQRVFELRTYYTNDGKLEALHKRFREHTNALFKKHGIEIVGFWTPQDKAGNPENQNKLVYLIAFPSREAAKASWKAFQDDPVWQKAREESHKNGVLVKRVESIYLDPTDYSPIK
jgi:hypothetical protein